MTSTCLLCYEDYDVFVLPPCNHKQICWKCCLKLVEGSIFSCPFCKDKPDQKSLILFVNSQQMNSLTYSAIMKNNPYRSNKNSFYFYSNKNVGDQIESETSFHCLKCGEVHQTMNLLKKHLNDSHRLQFCDVCLENRKCIISEQVMYSDSELTLHMKQGDISETGQLILYHPFCQFCKVRFYDLDSFKLHFRFSSHFKCEICMIANPKLKYVYYKNYDELQHHFKKSHFLCEKGDCIAKKLENVFASEEALEEHFRRCHKKHKGQNKFEKVPIIFAGFNKKPEEEAIEWDGIGKNFEKQFVHFESHERLEKQTHHDDLIDIREFYMKNSLHIKTEAIVILFDDLLNIYSLKEKTVNLSSVWLFEPLKMPNLFRSELEKFIVKMFDHHQASIINQLFFTQKNQFSSLNEFFSEIQRKMKNYSCLSFYLSFPQLVRYMKDENPAKVAMDEFYARKLHDLSVNKMFIFHEKKRYSEILEVILEKIELQMHRLVLQKRLDHAIYIQYFKDLNLKFYMENQHLMFFVSKERVTNLYHMVDKCKTKDLLKMNWLLKIGLSNESYKIIMRQFYFRTLDECGEAFTELTIQELALIYIYSKICLEAIFDKESFELHKSQTTPYFFSKILKKIPHDLSKMTIIEIQSLESKSLKVEKEYRQSKHKGVKVNEKQFASLLTVNFDPPPGRKPPEPPLTLGLGQPSLLSKWNEEETLSKKKFMQPNKKQEIDEFPALVEAKKNGKTRQNKRQDEQDFPVFNFNKKYIAPTKEKHQKKKEATNQLLNFISFNNKVLSNPRWDEEKTRQKMNQRQFDEEEQKKIEKVEKVEKQQKREKKEKIESNQIKKESPFQEIQQKISSKYSPKKEEVLVGKKSLLIDDESNKKVKSKKLTKAEEEVLKSSDTTIFEQLQIQAAISKQQNLEKKEKKSKLKAKLDLSSDEQVKNVNPLNPMNLYLGAQESLKGNSNKTMYQISKPIINEDEFESLMSSNDKASIVNKIINASSMGEEEKNVKVVKNKKGKKVTIEPAKWF